MPFAEERLWKLEVHYDLGLDFNWFIIQVVRLVLPLLDCLHGGARELGIAAHYFNVADVAIFIDSRLKLHWTLNSHLTCLLWIDGLNPLDQQPLGNSLRNFHHLGNRDGHAYWSRGDDSAQGLVTRNGGNSESGGRRLQSILWRFAY